MRPSYLSGLFHLLAAACSFLLLLLVAGSASANPDVYAALPADITVLQYGLGDVDGDSQKELAVLYSTDNKARLALFKAQAGRWTKWSDGSKPLEREDGAGPRTMEITDANGDGADEIIAYYLADGISGGEPSMVTRVLSLHINGTGQPELRNILEDRTVPPGYPLLGSEGQKPSVTFLQMSNGKSNGQRLVYCWNGNSFEKCVEVVWEKP